MNLFLLAWKAMKQVPLKTWLYLLFLAAVAGAVLCGRHHWIEEGRAQVQAVCDAEKAKAAAEIDRLKLKQAEITVKTEVVYRDRIKVIHEKGQTLIQRIPAEIPADACLLPIGFRVLVDEAAKGPVPDTARRPDADASRAEAIAWRPWDSRTGRSGNTIGHRKLHARE